MRFIASLFCLFVLFSPAQAQHHIRFESPEMLPEELASEFRIEMGDLDLDGDQDLVLSGEHGIRIWWKEDNGRYREELLPSGMYGDSTGGMALVDFDGDGDLDLISGRNPVGIWLNQFPGPFQPTPTGLPFESLTTTRTVVADFDLDGISDLYLATAGQDRLFLTVASTPRTLVDRTGWLTPDLRSSELALAGDWDQDGWPDLALIGDGELRVFLQLPGTTPSFSLSQEEAIAGATSLATADLDGDGDLDFYLGRDGDDSLFLNDGSGNFQESPGRIPAHPAITSGVALSDHDGDGDLDIALAHSGDTEAECWNRRLRNDGAGFFQEAGLMVGAPIPNPGVIAEDLDLDGDEDLLFLSQRRSRNTLHFADGAGRFSPAHSSLPGFYHNFWQAVTGAASSVPKNSSERTLERMKAGTMSPGSATRTPKSRSSRWAATRAARRPDSGWSGSAVKGRTAISGASGRAGVRISSSTSSIHSSVCCSQSWGRSSGAPSSKTSVASIARRHHSTLPSRRPAGS